MAAVLKLLRHIRNPTALIAPYLLEKQSCQNLSRSDSGFSRSRPHKNKNSNKKEQQDE